MSLIKLQGVPHPDLNGGKPQAVYIDASRVLLIIQGHVSHPKIGSVENQRDLYDQLHEASERLNRTINEYIPNMTDPVAVEWVRTINGMGAAVNDAYHHWGQAYRQGKYHPSVDCTEVQLACGTALEHGVMLTRVWVSDSVEDVALAVARATHTYK
jgi:enamine deaminase RidA (YjgF/YER057c/UK114 family)